jgi:DNA-binding NtrC family response regulator
LVVLDLGLPDMRGEDVLFHVLDRDPACRVLVSSGTPFSLEQVPPAQRTRVAILQKPYLPKTLLQCLEKMLGDGSVQ